MASKTTRKAIVAWCVECDSRVYFRTQPSLGQLISCRECGTKLEVIDLDPVELYWSDDFDQKPVDEPGADPYEIYDKYDYDYDY